MRARNFALILACLATLSASAASDETGPAPRFSAKTTAGERFNNESVKGKVVLLQFWTTWCQYCRREQPLVDALDRELAGKGLLVLAVDVGESKKKVIQYLGSSPRAVRIVLNEDTNLPALFAARGFPVYVVIDREGNVVGIQRGASGERALRRLISRAGIDAE